MSVNPLYLGCGVKCKPSTLHHYEQQKGWILQEKYDGWWCHLDYDGEEVTCTSRKGNVLTRPTEVFNAGSKPRRPMELVGEWLPATEYLVVFDIIALDGRDLRHEPLTERLRILGDTQIFGNTYGIRSFRGSFKSHYDYVVAKGGEGVVLKYSDSLYVTGQKNRKAKTWTKCKPRYEDETTAIDNHFHVAA